MGLGYSVRWQVGRHSGLGGPPVDRSVRGFRSFAATVIKQQLKRDGHDEELVSRRVSWTFPVSEKTGAICRSGAGCRCGCGCEEYK